MSATDTTAERRVLSRAGIVEVVLGLARKTDTTRITIRAIAAELGVTPMAIYRHFTNKAEIMDALVDRFADEMTLPVEVGNDLEWREWIRATYSCWRDALLETPGMIALLGTSHAYRLAGMQTMNSILGRLRSAGLSRDGSVRAFFTLSSYVIGAVATEVAFRSSPLVVSDSRLERRRVALERFQSASLDGLHTVSELARELADHQVCAPFEDGLDRILDSLERELSTD